MPDVECCVNNLDAERWRTLATDARVEQQHCLRRCGVCHDEPFLVVDGTVVTGDDHAGLLSDATATGTDEADRTGGADPTAAEDDRRGDGA
jgi:uncharacterized protein YuzB (UPF0349 family)